MEARALTHSLASVSGLQRCTPSLNSRLLPQLRQRAPLRVAAVASGLSRDAGSSSATSFPPQLGLNAPSAEEAAAPVALVSEESFDRWPAGAGGAGGGTRCTSPQPSPAPGLLLCQQTRIL